MSTRPTRRPASASSSDWNLGVSGQVRGGLHYALTVQDLLDEKPLQPAGLEVPFLPKAVPQPGRILRATVGGTF